MYTNGSELESGRYAYMLNAADEREGEGERMDTERDVAKT